MSLYFNLRVKNTFLEVVASPSYGAVEGTGIDIRHRSLNRSRSVGSKTIAEENSIARDNKTSDDTESEGRTSFGDGTSSSSDSFNRQDDVLNGTVSYPAGSDTLAEDNDVAMYSKTNDDFVSEDATNFADGFSSSDSFREQDDIPKSIFSEPKDTTSSNESHEAFNASRAVAASNYYPGASPVPNYVQMVPFTHAGSSPVPNYVQILPFTADRYHQGASPVPNYVPMMPYGYGMHVSGMLGMPIPSSATPNAGANIGTDPAKKRGKRTPLWEGADSMFMMRATH